RLARLLLPCDLPAVEHQHTRGEREDLFEVGGEEEHGLPLVPGAEEARVDKLDGAYVDAARRLGGEEAGEGARELPRDHNFLLVPSRERAGQGLWAPGSNIKELHPGGGVPANFLLEEHPEGG